ncbi:hypothetical protein H17ap60334_01866 [Thermosipho africanus H17ap60334]|jgi:hypothetical protein|uniref:hypothetical protein n=1 Tax=Thermosipho africanus TaxID=2421 RepID=UPI00028C7F0E|nr:hypothetical protein [Thermosipho africanus]EKF50062.1 hypothetical protein H17ap60334_01866 [Thermosipho africanus H17ap60334]MDK2900095.1 hypothetical protein [Thermosipho sp. (in: thermotogales)]RDI90147.1 hypothetical protein Ob7_09517 [Thermosipho africanus Ob7]HCF37753.1 hypothetical protein [Thermosipho africanus]
MNEEKYKEIISIVKIETMYKPGDLLEDRIIKNIKRQRLMSRLKKSSLVLIIVGAAVTVSFFTFDIKRPQNQLYTYEQQQSQDYVVKDFEPILNISLVSDGL